jgi:flagellar basal-body rod protein FlgC
MDYQHAFAISAAGLALERTRVEVAAANLAHANTVQDPAAPAFQPMRVVGLATPAPFSQLVDDMTGAAPPDFTLEPAIATPRRVLDPGHPWADEQGFVAYPGVDPAVEMVTLLGAMRAYEANLAALATARTLALKTLDIGRTA